VGANKLNIYTYAYGASKIKLPGQPMGAIPGQFAEEVRMCLNATPKLRPNSIQLTKISFFADDPLLKILNYLDSLMQMDNVQKMQFFKGLPSVLEKFPKVGVPCFTSLILDHL